jgi:hypothetical protein
LKKFNAQVSFSAASEALAKFRTLILIDPSCTSRSIAWSIPVRRNITWASPLTANWR